MPYAFFLKSSTSDKKYFPISNILNLLFGEDRGEGRKQIGFSNLTFTTAFLIVFVTFYADMPM